MKDYFYQDFPALLQGYWQQAKESQCPHHPIPRLRATFVDPIHSVGAFSDGRFWASWYFLNLIDQNLHAHFPAAYQHWTEQTNGYPIPMTQGGFGCIRRVAPSFLLLRSRHRHKLSKTTWTQACYFFLDEIEIQQEKLSISTFDFFQQLLKDKEFNQPKNRYESTLYQIIQQRYNL